MINLSKNIDKERNAQDWKNRKSLIGNCLNMNAKSFDNNAYLDLRSR